LEEHVDKNDEMENAQAKNKEMKKEVKRFDERIKKLIQDWK
jgi:predicted  nucleic acid-binding Zn-ribbon protein